MKKVLALTLVLVMILALALTISSCGKKVPCSNCGEEYSESKMDKTEISGTTIYMCPDCVGAIEDALGNLGDLFG